MIFATRSSWGCRASMNFNPVFLFLIFARHLMWSHVNSDGGTTTYYYDDEITWLLSAVAVALVSTEPIFGRTPATASGVAGRQKITQARHRHQAGTEFALSSPRLLAKNS